MVLEIIKGYKATLIQEVCGLLRVDALVGETRERLTHGLKGAHHAGETYKAQEHKGFGGEAAARELISVKCGLWLLVTLKEPPKTVKEVACVFGARGEGVCGEGLFGERLKAEAHTEALGEQAQVLRVQRLALDVRE